MSYLLMRFPQGKRKALTLSYDDGTRTDVRLANILNEHGLKCTFNINSGLFSAWSSRMSEEESLALYGKSVHEVAVHGVKHLSLAEVDKASATYEVVNDRRALEKLFNRVIKGMAYANGSYSDSVVQILKDCGISYARTTVSTERFDIPTDWLRLPATCHHNNPRLMELARTFIEEKEPAYAWARKPTLFYLWGHSHEFDGNDNWQVIEEFASYMGGRKDVWYATNGEIYAYVKAYDSLEFSSDGSAVYNPTATDVWLEFSGVKAVAKAGETTKTGFKF